MNAEQIKQLFHDTKTAFELSPVKKYAEENGHQWNYSISATCLTEGATMIVGFNWGVAGKATYAPQTEIPGATFKQLYDANDLGSLQRIYLPLKQRFPEEDVNTFTQTNFCFFRSRAEDEITAEDLRLSTPLFLQLISIVKPSRILGFSKKLQHHFLESNLCTRIETADFPSNKRTLHVAKGFLKQDALEIPIYFLPHPNAKFTSVARKNGWAFCFGQRRQNRQVK